MKKTLSLILALVMCLSLCACGNTKASDVPEQSVTAQESVIEQKDAWLQGIWIHDENYGRGDSLDGTDLPKEFCFEHGNVKTTSNESNTSLTGTYTIDGDLLLCSFDDSTITLQLLTDDYDDIDFFVHNENDEGLFLMYFRDGKTPELGNGGSSSNFTNAYGTATTICAKSGCNHYIASSGDTNCCVTHSNRCLNCNCYIDGDAMYCMSCLSGAASNSGS